MTLMLTISSSDKTSLQVQIFEQIRGLILDGTLKTGAALPATRSLSEQLGLSRNTVTLAYSRLCDEGYIEMKESVGTFVSQQIPDAVLHAKAIPLQVENGSGASNLLPDSAARIRDVRSQSLVSIEAPEHVLDFCIGRPDPESFPTKIWSRLIQTRLLSSGAALTEYNNPAGLIELREALADHLRAARGMTTDPENIVIVSGSQDGLNLICRMLVEPRTVAVLEETSYQGAAFLFESFGMPIHPVPLDEDGLDVSQMPNIQGALAYVTPSHQYPMGATLPLNRRLELLEWAERNNAFVIEDDYDSDFRYQGAPTTALKGLDHSDRVIYLGTLSKVLGPGLRLGYVVLPKSLVSAARHFKTLMNNGQPWLEQAVLADFISSGHFERHIRKIRKHYYSRRNALIAALETHLPGCRVIAPNAGMHLTCKLSEDYLPASQIEERALKAGVRVYSFNTGAAVHFGPNDDDERYLMFGFSSLDDEKIERGIAKVAAVARA